MACYCWNSLNRCHDCRMRDQEHRREEAQVKAARKGNLARLSLIEALGQMKIALKDPVSPTIVVKAWWSDANKHYALFLENE